MSVIHRVRSLSRLGGKLRSYSRRGFRFWLLVLSLLVFGISLFNAIDYVLNRERMAFLYTNQDNYLLVQTYQETERLLDALDGYVLQDSMSSVSRDELMLRFEMLVSRIPLLTEGEVGKRISALPGVKAVVEELRSSLLGMEPMLAKLEPNGDTPSYQAIRWELQRHRDALFELSREFLLSPGGRELDPTPNLAIGLGYWHFAAAACSGLLLIALFATQLQKELKSSEAWAKERNQWRQTKRELSYQATHDALTGLINRGELERRLQRVFASAQIHGCEGAVLYLDLDRFKPINDNCGHLAGDQLLRQIATLLRTRVRKRDTLARLGGDEFVALLEHCPLPKALRVAEEILETVHGFRFVWEDKTFAVGISIGIAPVTIGSESPETVLMAADKACYTAKGAGRNCARIYTDDVPVSQWQADQKLWVTRIEKGLSNDCLRLFSQTITPLGQREARGEHYEIFLRLEDEKGRLALPEAFFSTAERYNLMAALDRWVIRRTLEWLNSDAERLTSLGICFINLSAQSLIDTQFQGFIHELLAESRVSPKKLCFEISEETAMSNLGTTIELVHALNTLGCHFALDHFGAGMSMFSYLKVLPVDFIKIDGGLVKDIAKDPVDNTLVHAINEIGQVMGKRTIAEFVESKAILDEVQRIGVDFAQGYGIAMPRPLESQSVSALVV